jgi:hypothetical protein
MTGELPIELVAIRCQIAAIVNFARRYDRALQVRAMLRDALAALERQEQRPIRLAPPGGAP